MASLQKEERKEERGPRAGSLSTEREGMKPGVEWGWGVDGEVRWIESLMKMGSSTTEHTAHPSMTQLVKEKNNNQLASYCWILL